ncbi:hypothetical protein MLD38_034963 [Melastoma candidum]|uniref:Uncharacterized protein n=1 Tax=Melastoma candidum TaxID=119954 RepID=A0ACB9MB84_9MYRT|nr:hypothetical protein MLD38_034963 [Melastoma candidum]
MNLRHLVSRNAIEKLSRLNHGFISRTSCLSRSISTLSAAVPVSGRLHYGSKGNVGFCEEMWRDHLRFGDHRSLHSAREAGSEVRDGDGWGDDEDDDGGTTNEFLSRFVWIMRGKLNEAYPDCDKQAVDGMLLLIVEKVVDEMEKGSLQDRLGTGGDSVSHDLSEDLWRTVWEVSNKVVEDMEKERKKEKMKGFLQDAEVKEMCRFAGEVGIRGDMLREFRFKWAREKMEESEFSESLEKFRKKEVKQGKDVEADSNRDEASGEEAAAVAGRSKVLSLPKRKGKFKYKIYGLDLSDPRWSQVADKIHEAEEVAFPQEPKPITGKCKLVTEKILSMGVEDNPSPLLTEWVELLQPSRVDWISLLDKIQEKHIDLYYKVAELLLDEASFQADALDFSKLIAAHAKEMRFEDAERIFKKMNDNGFPPDILTATVLIHMYNEAGNVVRAKEVFDNLRNQGFRPDFKIYKSMIMGYVKAGQPKLGEDLVRVMEMKDIKPTREIYMALLHSFVLCDDITGAASIITSMQYSGLEPSLEEYTLLIDACGKAKKPEQARSHFNYLRKMGHKLDDKITASMIAAYEKSNLLDQALDLLLELERNGFEPGVHTNSVLVDWFAKLQLLDEAEKLLDKISQQGESPPFRLQVSLCNMYSRARMEKRALQALGILESKKDEMDLDDFQTAINGLEAGGFIQQANRLRNIMESRGFTLPEAPPSPPNAPNKFSLRIPRRPSMR